MSGQGVGSSVPRKEDDRYMRGRGQFVADIKLPGMKEVAFLRSPLAHARIVNIHVPEKWRGAVFAAVDLAGVKPIRAGHQDADAAPHEEDGGQGEQRPGPPPALPGPHRADLSSREQPSPGT